MLFLVGVLRVPGAHKADIDINKSLCTCPSEGFDTRPRKREPRLRDAALYYGMTNATSSRTSGYFCCWERWETLKRRTVRRIVFGVPVSLLSMIASIPQIGARGISSPHLGRYQSDDTIRKNLPKVS